MLGRGEFAKVCAKVVAEGEFQERWVLATDMEEELRGKILEVLFEETTMHGWVTGP